MSKINKHNAIEEAAIKWADELTTATNLLLTEKNLLLAVQIKAFKTEKELKTLRAENPNNILKNQQKSLQIALNTLSETKNKTVLGAIEMVAISVSLCALSMTTIRYISSDLFLALTSFKIPAMSLIGSIVGSSGLLGWNTERKASLEIRMAQDEVKASQTAVNQCKIRCQDYESKLKLKIAETKSAQEELTKVNLRVTAATEAVKHAEQNLNKANKAIAVNDNKNFSDNTNTTFSQSPHLRALIQKSDPRAEAEKSKAQEERSFNTHAYM